MLRKKEAFDEDRFWNGNPKAHAAVSGNTGSSSLLLAGKEAGCASH
jgi:hypothetical protein